MALNPVLSHAAVIRRPARMASPVQWEPPSSCCHRDPVSDLSQLTGKDFERIAWNLNPGGWAVEMDRPIATLLGSCVAVCLYDPKLKIGGMNHFLLPSRARSANADTDIILSGDFAMEILANSPFNPGARKERLVAKAFGGGTIVSSIRMAREEDRIVLTSVKPASRG